MSMRIGLLTVETGRQNPGIVHDQGIAWLELVQNMVKVAVSQCPFFSVQNEQARGIPYLQWCLSNQLLG